MFRKFVRSKNKSLISKTAYKKARNELTHITQKAKKSHYNNLFRMSYGDPKSLWRNIEKVIQFKKKTSSNIQFLEDGNGHRISNSDKMCDYFNDFFINIGKNLSDNITESSGINSATQFLSSNLNSLFFAPLLLLKLKT